MSFGVPGAYVHSGHCLCYCSSDLSYMRSAAASHAVAGSHRTSKVNDQPDVLALTAFFDSAISQRLPSRSDLRFVCFV